MIYQIFQYLINFDLSAELMWFSMHQKEAWLTALLILMFLSSSLMQIFICSSFLIADIFLAIPWVACHLDLGAVKSVRFACDSGYSQYITANYHFDIWYVWIGYIVVLAILSNAITRKS